MAREKNVESSLAKDQVTEFCNRIAIRETAKNASLINLFNAIFCKTSQNP